MVSPSNHTSVVSMVSQPPNPTALLMQSGKQLRNEQDPQILRIW